MKVKMVSYILLGLITCIFVINTLAYKFFLYWRIPWLDMPMHFLGGFWLGLTALWVYFLSGRFERVIVAKHRTRAYVVFLSVLSAMVFGSLWEAYEFGIDTFIRFADFYDIQDMLADLFFDLCGSLVVAGLFITNNLYLKKDTNV